MENRTINIGVVEEVAAALKNLKEQIVFIGGAVISLYADDPAADEIRPTGDIMSAEDGPMGPANKWYKIGFEDLWIVKAIEEEINILKAPCYLATKFEAFNDRGEQNYRTSHDFEDIIYVIDNRINIVEEIEKADERIKSFLVEEVIKILGSPSFEEILSVHLLPLIAEERYPLLLEKFVDIRNL